MVSTQFRSTIIRARISALCILAGTAWLLAAGFAQTACANRWEDIFQQDQQYRQTFNAALLDYRNGDYAQAEQKFRQLVNTGTQLDRQVVALYIGKSLFSQRLYEEADSWLSRARDEFGGGLYEDALLHLSGNTAYMLGDPLQAAWYYVRAYHRSRDPRTKNLIVSSLIPLFERWLSDAELREVADLIPGGHLAGEFHYARARRFEQQDRYSLAQDHYRQALDEYPEAPWANQVDRRVDQLQRRHKKTTYIGLLYPVDENFSDYGITMRRAAQIAAEHWETNEAGYMEIIPEIFGKDDRSIEAAAQALGSSRAQAIIGPLTSQQTEEAASVLATARVPQVAPMATRPGLTDISSHLYQLGVTAQTVAKALVDHAVDRREARTFGVIAPNDEYGKEIAEAFATAARHRGGLVFPIQLYEPGVTDHRREIMSLKNIVLEELYDEDIFYTEDDDTLDAEQVHARLDGIILPGDAEDLNYILPQIRFYNLYGQYYGTDGWANPQALDRSREYLAGAIFASAEHLDPARTKYRRFAGTWMKRYSVSPDLIAARTYDAVTLAASQLVDRRLFRAALASDIIYNGASGRIEISRDRQNTHIPLYGYLNKMIVPAFDIPYIPPPPDTSTIVGPE